MLFVVTSHLYELLDRNGSNGLMTYIVNVQLPLFMFLSGIVITTPPYWHKTLNKVKRFILPFLVVGLLWTAYIGRNVLDFFQAEFKLGYWYLLTLAEFYVILLLWNIFKVKRHRFTFDLLLTAFVYLILRLSVYLFHRYSSNVSIDYLSIERMTSMWPYFAFGCLARWHGFVKYLNANNILYPLAVGLILIFLFIIPWVPFTRYYIYFPFAFASIIVAVYLFRIRENSKSKIERGLAFVGRHSLDVYIFHYFFVFNVRLVVVKRWTEATGNGLIEFLVYASLAVFIATVCIGIGWCVRQNKWTKLVVYGV